MSPHSSRFVQWRCAALLVPFLLAGCGPRSTHDRGPSADPSGEAEKTAQVTVWGERFEVFLEHKLLVVGKAAVFVTHVTDQETLEPRTEGPLKLVLRFGAEAPREHLEPAPNRPGIYLPTLVFDRAGSWRVTLHIPISGGESVIELPPFQVFASQKEASEAPEQKAPEGITFLKEQQWKLLTKTEPIKKHTLVERLRVTGTVVPRAGARAHVTPPSAGRLLPAPGKPWHSLGDLVEAGETLALVQPPFSDFATRLAEAEADVVRTKLAIELAELVHKRMQQLAADQLRTERELQEAAFAVRRAQADQAAALAVREAFQKSGAAFVTTEASGSVPCFALRAPIAGTIVALDAVLGEHVTADRAIAKILDPSVVWIVARIPEAALARVAATHGASYERPDQKGIQPILGAAGGRVVHVGLEVDQKSRTVPITYEVSNADGALRVGMALEVHLETQRVVDGLAIPESALVDEEGRPTAYVQVSGETFEKRELTLGVRDTGFVQVLRGLAEGERAMTKGAYAVRLASISTTIPAHGHAH